MNTKQVEELVGVSRQNIRYYEKEGLLTPCREQGNSYRDYSQEDVERLKLIKMLRMLDMPLKDIALVLNNEVPLQDAVAVRQKELLEQQKRLQAAIDICNLIKKEKSSEIDVNKYLNKMEHMERNGNVFARIIDDYKQAIREEEEKQIVFYTDRQIDTSLELERLLKNYAKEHGLKFKIKEKGKYPQFYLNEELYSAAYSFQNPGYQIVCRKIEDVQKRFSIALKFYSLAVNIRRHFVKSICSFAISLMLVLLLGIYLGNLHQVSRQIENLSDSMPVYASIYNNSGNYKRHLQIEEKIVEGIRASTHVARVEETVELIGKGKQGENYQILALENEKISSLKKGQCLASPLFLKNNNLEAGDTIYLPVYCYVIDMMTGQLTERFMLDYKWEIAGSCEMEEDIHIPLNDAKELFEESKNAYYASSLSFRVKEPKLLNELKAEMQALGLQTIQSGAKENFYGRALGIEDATFIEASIKLENDKTLLQSFLPIIYLLLLVAEYLVSYLLLQSRRQEFAIMRALGKSKKACSRSLMTEQMTLVLAGMIVGSMICRLIMNMEWMEIFVMMTAFLVIAMSGLYSAIWMLGRFRVSAVLTCRD